MIEVESGAGSSVDQSWKSLQTTWERRNRLAAAWLQNDRIVADIGCGLMTLEPLLASGSTYIPVDVVARDSRTIVVDFNADPIPAVKCDVAVLLGVLEYGDNVASILRQLRQFPKVVFSYNHISLNDVLWKLGVREKRVSWKNRHSRRALRQMLQDCGLKVVRARWIRMGEMLYEAIPAQRPPV